MKKNIKLRTWALCLALVMVLTSLVLVNAFANGETCDCGGTYDNGFCGNCGSYQPAEKVGNYYQISNAGQLYWFADYVSYNDSSANAKLTANITVNTGVLNADGYVNSGDFRYWNPINYYYGTFDGQYFTISGLYCSTGGYTGLFGYLESGATVKNVGVLDSYFYGSDSGIGGVVGYNYGTVLNCYSASYVCGGYDVGGVVGYNSGGTVKNCYNLGRVYGDDDAGGIVGENQGAIQNCYNMGNVSCGSYYYGGIIGYGSGAVSNCYYLYSDSGYGYGSGYGTAMYESDFASGEVARLLGKGFEQEVGVDAYPVFHTEHTFEDGACTGCGAITPPEQDENGYYILSTVEELYWFAEYVNDTDASISAKLINSITVNENVLNTDGSVNYGTFQTWMPAGREGNPYTGKFDGQGFTISGLYCSSGSNYVGLFGHMGEGAEVRNLGIEDSYFYGNYYVGSVAGMNNGGVVTDCYNAGRIGGYYHVGGVVGDNPYGIVKNCYNIGAVDGNNYAGGVVGNNNYGTVKNCYNHGTVSGYHYIGGVIGSNNAGIAVNCYNVGLVNYDWYYNWDEYYNYAGGVVGSNYGIASNCYYLEGALNDPTPYCSIMSAEDFASGKVAFLLGGAFGQKLGEDLYPVFRTEDNSVRLLSECNEAVFTNEYNAITNHQFDENGFCTREDCIGFGYQPAVDFDGDGHYEISNAGQLYWFADLVNRQLQLDAKALLVENIVVNENTLDEEGYLNEGEFRSWMPIGSEADPYVGHFAGNNKTISGLYFNDIKVDNVGLFGRIGAEATVENVNVADSYFHGKHYVGGIVGYNDGGTVNHCSGNNHIRTSYYYFDDEDFYAEGEGRYIGGIVGRNHGTVKNCSNSGMVRGYTKVGGIVGCNDGIVENCSNSGAVRGSGGEDESYYVGGIVGNNGNEAVVRDCYNAGAVSGENYVGGIVGSNEGAVTNCYNRGSVSGYWYVGGVIGRIPGDSSGSWTNCYYLEGCAEEDNEYGTPKTEAEFASGEVMLLLGEAFGQDLSKGEKWPTLGGPRYTMIVAFTNGEEVYYEDLAEAVAAAKEDAGCTLIMLADSFKGEALINAGDFNLEFRGKQMNSTLVVAENADITIKNGKFTNITAQNGGKVTINGENVILTGVLKAEDGEITIIEAAVEAGLKLEGIALNEILDRNSFGRNEDGEVTTAVTKICVICPGASLDEATITVDDAAYTGEAVTPEVVITIGGKMLEKGVDFDITYTNNTALGINTAEVTIRAIAPYTGEKTLKFSIVNCATDFDALIKALEERLKALEESNDLSEAVQEAINEIRAKIAEIQQEYAKAEDLEAAVVRIEALEDAIAALENRVSANETAIEQIRQELDQVREDVMNALNSGNADLAEQIQKLKTVLNMAIAANGAADAEMEAELQVLIREAKATLQIVIDKVAADLEQAKLDVNAAILAGDTDLAQKIAALQSAMNVATEVSNAADNVLKAELSDAVATLNAAIAALQNRVETEKERLNSMLVLAIVMAGVVVAGCVGLTVYVIVDKRKLVR